MGKPSHSGRVISRSKTTRQPTRQPTRPDPAWGAVTAPGNLHASFLVLLIILFLLLFLFILSGCAAPKRVYRHPPPVDPSAEGTERARESGGSASAEADKGELDPNRPLPSWDTTTAQYQAAGMQASSLALAQTGRPYRYGGSNPSGFDCSGLVMYVYGLVDVDMPRTVLDQVRIGREISLIDALPGDLLFFRIDGSRISHVGIYAGDGVFVHAPHSGQVVEQETLSSSWWRERLVAVRRIVE